LLVPDYFTLLCVGSAVPASSPQAASDPRIVVVEKASRELVDENNAIVKDLVSAGYTVEQSIEAVDTYETLEAALDYLEMGEEEEEGEHGVIPIRCNIQISREDSEEAARDW
jgi:hypothetical protein